MFIFLVCYFLKDVSVFHFVYLVPANFIQYYLVLVVCRSVKCLSNSIVGVEVGPNPVF